MSSTPASQTRWLTTREAIEYSKTSYGSLHRAVASGRLKAFRVSTGVGALRQRFRQQELDAWLTATPVKPAGAR